MEAKTWWKSVTYTPRVDYLSFQSNELVYVLAVEKLLGMEVPRRATWARMALAELNRIHSHLIWLGTSALELGAISLLWYTFDDRDELLDLFEMAAGARMHALLPGWGLAEDLPPAFTESTRKFCEDARSVDDYEALLDRNAIWLERTKGIGLLSASDALALGQSGPMLRSSGVDWDLRKNMPYLFYDEVEFDVPVYPNGDVYDRYKVHLDEMRESVRIVGQCLDRIDDTSGEPWIADDRKVVLPPRHELHTSMESLIHHFKIVTEGYVVPEGEVYVVIESARGESGCYVVSDGGPRPWREVPRPSFAALQATATTVQGPRRRPRRDRRLARPGHGRRGSMPQTYDRSSCGGSTRRALGGDGRAPARPGRARRLAPARGAPRGRGRARRPRRSATRSRPSTTCPATWSRSGGTWSRCARTSPAPSPARRRCSTRSRPSSVSSRERRPATARSARDRVCGRLRTGARRRRRSRLPRAAARGRVPALLEELRGRE